MIAEIINTGTELLLGQITNDNARYLSKKLSSLGIDVYFHTTVGDNKGRLAEVLRRAISRSDIVITTGGLGPTMDDLTKETVAEALNLNMEMDKSSLESVRGFFEKRGKRMPENNIKQAYFPTGAIILPNNVGTAPGAIIEKDGKIIIMLPGPPMEMNPMFEDYVFDFLRCKTGKSTTVIQSRVLKIFGLGESAVEENIRDLVAAQTNPTIAFQAKPAEIHIRLTSKAHSSEEAIELIKKTEEKIRERIGKHIFGVDGETLEEVVGKLIAAKNFSLSVAESCTGGLLSSKLTDIPGSSDYFLYSIVSYSNEAKMIFLGVKKKTLEKYGAVSEETAREMAEGVRKIGSTDLAVAITGIAGPGGGTPQKPVGLVYIALAAKNHLECRKFNFAGNRTTVKLLSCNAALNMLRHYLIN